MLESCADYDVLDILLLITAHHLTSQYMHLGIAVM